jgi:pimeloyl-ACP methyl ester carboxylesterase
MSIKREFAYAEGRCLSYADFGDPAGYPILAQHGLIASIDDGGLFDRLLRAEARLICVARPGYGESSPAVLDSYAGWADIVSPLIDELGLTQFDVLGTSSGAPYSYALGYRFPDKVRNIYIFSGVPALYDAEVLARWPYPPTTGMSIAELQDLAHELFFSNLAAADLAHIDIRDSTANNAFGVAQDLRLRFRPWGFSLSDVREKVYLRHSRQDGDVPFETAVRTAELLPNCELEIMETGPHFSNEALDEFIRDTIVAGSGSLHHRRQNDGS